jgi:benzoate transport
MTEPAAGGHGLPLREAIDRGEMSRFQIVAVALCVVLNMLDGFDVQVMSFTASEVAEEWRLTGVPLGRVLSAGLVGMAVGSLFVAPWADRFGRRATILACLGVITAGMAASAFAPDPTALIVLRVVTGIGVGGILASLNVITSEYSSRRWRNTAISLQVTGYPVGATIGGSIAAFLISHYGWRSAFLFGAVASALMFPAVIRHLPESLDFLVARRPPGALDRLNDLLRRMGRPALPELPPPIAEGDVRRNPVSRLFAAGAAGPTLLVWGSFFLVMFGFYFIMSWTPKLLVAAGLTTTQGITGGVLLNLGGIAGGSLFGYLTTRVELTRLARAYLCATAVCTALFGLLASGLTPALLIALAIGVFLFGSMTGLYAVTPALYPAEIRTTGMGWAIGIGRIGAILAPVVAGFLVDARWSNAALYYAFAVPFAVAVVLVYGLRPPPVDKGATA